MCACASCYKPSVVVHLTGRRGWVGPKWERLVVVQAGVTRLGRNTGCVAQARSCGLRRMEEGRVSGLTRLHPGEGCLIYLRHVPHNMETPDTILVHTIHKEF